MKKCSKCHKQLTEKYKYGPLKDGGMELYCLYWESELGIMEISDKLGTTPKRIRALMYWYLIPLREVDKITPISKSTSFRDNQGRKFCSRCERWLPESEFGERLRSADGLRGHCKDCFIKYYRKSRNLKSISLLPNPFPKNIKFDWHHLNRILVVPIPRIIHRANNHCSSEIHQKKLIPIIESIYSINLNGLLTGEW